MRSGDATQISMTTTIWLASRAASSIPAQPSGPGSVVRCAKSPRVFCCTFRCSKSDCPPINTLRAVLPWQPSRTSWRRRCTVKIDW